MAVNSEQPIIIKKIKKGGGHGHHGGAWKVAYADFVTAMMAFFLLMWLLNTTSPEQKQGIADYFAPASISSTTSGSGGILGGTSLGDDGAKADGKMSVIQQMAPEAPDNVSKDGQSSTSANLDSASEQALRDALAKKEQDAFASAAQSLRQSLQDMPELAELSKQILIDQTPEGLRIQLVDQEGRAMFQENSKVPNDRAKVLLRAVAKVINQLPNRVTISGHTSANAYGKKQDGDWALSAERADASRQVLRGFGVSDDRVYQVQFRTALRRRPDSGGQPTHLDRAAEGKAGSAGRPVTVRRASAS
jgi:chemotaxis protein MotB